MKYIFTLCCCLCLYSETWSQAIYLDHMPADSNDSFTLFINVAEAGPGLYSFLQSNPEEIDNVYIWIWNPVAPLVGNGSWFDSNEELIMTHVSDYTYSIFISIPLFFNVENDVLFENGISCLAKLDSGGQQTSDLHLDLTTIGINERAIISNLDWNMFPNPCTESVNILVQENQAVQLIRILSTSGVLIREERLSSIVSNLVVNTSALPRGCYFTEVNNGTTVSRKKLMKE